MGFIDWLMGTPEPAPEPGPLVVPAAPTPQDIATALAKAEQMAGEQRAPEPVLARVSRITGIVRNTLPRLANLGLDSKDAYHVVATATDYLPESLAGYLALPRDWANTRPVANGKSSLLMLIDQLDLLALTMNRMYDAAYRRDAAALVAQGQFLDQKFANRPAAAVSLDAPRPVSGNPLDLESR